MKNITKTIQDLKEQYLAEPLKFLIAIKKDLLRKGVANRKEIRKYLGMGETNTSNKLKDLRKESLVKVCDNYRPKAIEITKRGNSLLLAILEDLLF